VSKATYSSAIVHFLDRASQTVEPAMMYPITRIELKEVRGEAIVTARIFVVNGQGRWVEAS
jgi:hypothetical protein